MTGVSNIAREMEAENEKEKYSVSDEMVEVAAQALLWYDQEAHWHPQTTLDRVDDPDHYRRLARTALGAAIKVDPYRNRRP